MVNKNQIFEIQRVRAIYCSANMPTEVNAKPIRFEVTVRNGFDTATSIGSTIAEAKAAAIKYFNKYRVTPGDKHFFEVWRNYRA